MNEVREAGIVAEEVEVEEDIITTIITIIQVVSMALITTGAVTGLSMTMNHKEEIIAVITTLTDSKEATDTRKNKAITRDIEATITLVTTTITTTIIIIIETTIEATNSIKINRK